MKVRELIEKLKELNPEAQVCVLDTYRYESWEPVEEIEDASIGYPEGRILLKS